MRLAFHREAELELIEAAAFYDHQVDGLGEPVLAVAHHSRRPDYWRSRFPP